MASGTAGRRARVTHYELLGVEPTASHQEIKLAYHRKARRYHPDATPAADTAAAEAARRKMIRINAAWAALSDPARRRAYDAEIGVHGTRRPPPRWTPPRWTPIEPDDDVGAGPPETEDGRARGPADVVVLVPVGLLGLAGAAFAFSMLAQSTFWMSVAIVLLPLALVTFAAMPLVVMFLRRPS